MAGRSGLGICCDGPWSAFPVDLLDSLRRRYFRDSMRGPSALRRHQTDRYGILIRCSTAIPPVRPWLAGDSRVDGSCRKMWSLLINTVINTVLDLKGSGELSLSKSFQVILRQVTPRNRGSRDRSSRTSLIILVIKDSIVSRHTITISMIFLRSNGTILCAILGTRPKL